MALTSIVSPSGKPAVFVFARGNVGVLVDIQSRYKDVLQIPSGGGAGSVFPSEGDVDFGVTYGPTGTDYTGSLVQPIESNVLTGVQYGANGTEFTGTATGGGETSYVF